MQKLPEILSGLLTVSPQVLALIVGLAAICLAAFAICAFQLIATSDSD
jgi:hypothetical protein